MDQQCRHISRTRQSLSASRFAWACCNSTSSTANEVETEPNPFPAALRAKFNQDVQDFEVLAAAPLEVFEEEDRYYVVEIESVKDFGVLFDATGGQGLVVADVNEAGAAEAWNRANPESQIKVFDSVRNVNGKTGNATELVSELQKEVGRVRLTMRRPLEFEVYLEKQGKPLGLTLSRNTKSLGLVILGVKEGPCKDRHFHRELGCTLAFERGQKALQQQTVRDPKYCTTTTKTTRKTICTLQQRGL
ncbi:unnamed protein product [Polarella glacialis]|uniref:PDZ domain-containing protein n=1 Tax=Polarella glacialis TaxID=89957 RepID=A0A813HMG5_POLGL|nr:unnamed protein product [Polarella glacialis]